MTARPFESRLASDDDIAERRRPTRLCAHAIETEAVADPDTGLLDRFERRIRTQIGPDTRLSRDSWTLEPQVPAP